MIVGIGVDIVAIERLASALRRTPALAGRLFTDGERARGPASLAGWTFCGVLYNVAQLSYRQAICPPELLGRMNAAVRWIVWGTLPVGSLLGGTLGTVIGIRPALWVAAAGSSAAGLWVFFSPLRHMRDVPVRGVPQPHPAALTPR